MNYSTSDYSFFSSYSGVDNEASQNQVSDFINALSNNLKHAIKNKKIDGIEEKDHMNYLVRPKISEGVLKTQLIERIQTSFCYVAFVGDGFLNSTYCNIELDFIFKALQNEENSKPCYFFALNENSFEQLRQKFSENRLPDMMIHKLYKNEEHNGLPMDDVDPDLQIEIIKEIRNSIIHKITESVLNQRKKEQEIMLQSAEKTYGKPNTDNNVINIFINENENDRIDIKHYLDTFKDNHFPDKKHIKIFPMPLSEIDDKQLALINEYADGVILSGRGAASDNIRNKILDQKIHRIMLSTTKNKGEPVSGFVLLKCSSKDQRNERNSIKTLWQVFNFIFDPSRTCPR